MFLPQREKTILLLYILTNDNQSTKYRTLCYPICALTSLRRLVVRRFQFVDVFPNTVKSRLGLTSQIDCIAENCRKIGTFTPYSLTSILRTQRALLRGRGQHRRPYLRCSRAPRAALRLLRQLQDCRISSLSSAEQPPP